MDDYSELRKIHAHGSPIISMQICGSKLVSGGSDGTVKEWDLQSGKLVRELADANAVWQVGYTRGKTVAALARDGNVVLEVSSLCTLKDFAMKLWCNSS
jgi:WD40 repeat protein